MRCGNKARFDLLSYKSGGNRVRCVKLALCLIVVDLGV